MGTLILIGLVVLVIVCLQPSARRAAGGHTHGGNRGLVARHEAGHAVAATAVGGRVRSGTMTSGKSPSGLVRAVVPDARAEITFLMAGRAAGGSSSGCSADDAAIRKTLREFPSAQRAQVRRDCEKRAQHIVSSSTGEIQRLARRLDERGRL